jgi:hypothetical protein
MRQVVGAPKKKKQKTKNNNVVQGESKEKMVSKVSKESPKAVQQQHIYVKRDNAHCTSS